MYHLCAEFESVKKFLLIFSALIGLSAHSQEFLDKEFYLLDSLKEIEISEETRQILDSTLSIFHESDSEIDKLHTLHELCTLIDESELWSSYLDELLIFSYNRMFSGKRSESDRLEFKRIFAKSVNDLGQLEIDKGNLVKSLDYFLSAKDMLLGIGKAEDYVSLYSNIGTSYFHQGDIKQAEVYMTLAVDSMYDTRNMELRALVLNNLAVIYQEQRLFEKSLIYHHQSLKLAQSENNVFGEGMSYNNIGGIYAQSFKDSVYVGLDYLDKALVIFKSIDQNDWTAMTYDKIALTQLKMGMLSEAETNANFSLLFALKSGATQPTMRAYRTLYKVKDELNKGGEAFDYYQKYVHIRDSIYNASLKISSASKELEYQYKTDKEISEKQHESSLAISEAENTKQEIITYAILILALIVLLFAAIQLRRNKEIKRQKAKIESQSEERKLLLKEIHHRVKNNFQIVCSVLRLQACDEDNSVISAAFEDAVNRIQSMAEVHDMIYKEESFANIMPVDYFKKLTTSLKFSSYSKEIEYTVKSDINELEMDTMISLGISINELITNSIKHAFDDSILEPKIIIDLSKKNGKYVLKYSDNGVGFDVEQVKSSFGTELIEVLIEQIQGELKYLDSSSGMQVSIKFKEAG
jgi:two-component sensor histidine kinase